MLNNFKTGWQSLFEKRLVYIKTLLGDSVVITPERYTGMLRIKFETSDENMQYMLNCVSYKIERESAKICEHCGKYGVRRFDEVLDEPICLCLDCYVLTVDSILSQQK